MSGTSELAARAAALIREHGWVQHHMGSHLTGFCIMGACDWALEDLADSEWDDLDDLMAALWQQIDPAGTEVSNHEKALFAWNDSPDRTEGEVLAVLDKTGA